MALRKRCNRRRSAIALTFAVLLAAGPSANADDNLDRPAAEALFGQGVELVKKGDFEAGCPKFDAALKLWPSAATALNIARCHEQFKRTASAWSAYHRALSLAKEADGIERRKNLEERARAGIAATEPQLAKLSIIIDAPQPLPADLLIERDGVQYPRGSLGVAIPVDPGKSTLRVSAPGYLPYSSQFEALGARTVEIRVTLEPAPPPPVPSAEPTVVPPPAPSVVLPPPPASGMPPAPPSPFPESPAVDGEIPLWAWIVGASGIAFGATSVGFLVDDLDAITDLKSQCDLTGSPARCSSGYDVEADNRRKNRSLPLAIGFGAGALIALGTSLAGIVIGSEGASGSAQLSGYISPWGAGAGIEGRF